MQRLSVFFYLILHMFVLFCLFFNLQIYSIRPVFFIQVINPSSFLYQIQKLNASFIKSISSIFKYQKYQFLAINRISVMKLLPILILFYILQIGLTKCPQNCGYCQSQNSCIECYYGFFLNPKGKCELLSTQCPICSADDFTISCQQKQDKNIKTIQSLNQRFYLKAHDSPNNKVYSNSTAGPLENWIIERNFDFLTYAIIPNKKPKRYLTPYSNGTVSVDTKVFDKWVITPSLSLSESLNKPVMIVSQFGTLTNYDNGTVNLSNEKTILGTSSIWMIENIE